MIHRYTLDMPPAVTRVPVGKRIASLLWKIWYPLLTRLTKNAELTFLNYGFAPANPADQPTLQPPDEPHRPCIQLYHRVASAVDLRDRAVLEVSCGHGGGASYVARYLHPRCVTGLDRNPRAIDLCTRTHLVANLTFIRGDALALPFADASLDVVINVEASHCYPDVARFLAEVTRVLRPGGHLLFADFRDAGAPLDLLHTQFIASGLQILAREDISQHVLRGMQHNTPRYQHLIETIIPRPLQKSARNFAGTKDSAIYKSLLAAQTLYLRYHLQKPD